MTVPFCIGTLVDMAASDSATRDKAIERSTRAARERAAQRVQQFLDAARSIIDEKGSTEFTVQEIVDQSKQSLRSFYQYFDGKHELLLALFEEEMGTSVGRILEGSQQGDPLERLEAVVLEMFAMSSPDRLTGMPIFADFALRLLIDHPDEVVTSYGPLVDYLAELIQLGIDDGLLRPGDPRRIAAVLLQPPTFAPITATGGRNPITGAEVWDFCLHAIGTEKGISRAA